MDRLYAQFIRPGDLVFDVGAHVGDRVASFRRLGARVIAVEPQPALYRTLRLLFGRDANITLAVHHNSGDTLDDEAVRAMALHEIGHLLGLDHTTDSTSVMAARVRVRQLSDADRATARLIYTLPAGPVR